MGVVLGYQQPRYAPMALEVTPGPLRYRHVEPIHENDVEQALATRLGHVPGRILERQVRCCFVKPDIVIRWRRGFTIVEIKRWCADGAALNQLTGYVRHWSDHLVDLAEEWTIFGILAAPEIDPELELPRWCAFQRLDVRLAARRT